MSLPAYLEVKGGLVYLHAKVQPRASRNEIGEALGTELKIKVAAPPVDSAANEALIRFLADVLQCSRSAIQLVRGGTSRHKLISVRDLPAGEIYRRLSEESS